MDWSSLVEFSVSPWELVVRGSAIYWFLFLVFRFLLRRDVGGLGVADVLLVVLVADASQNAMTGGYTSIAEGLVLISTLLAWNYGLDWLSFRFRSFERFLVPRPLLLIRNGRVIHENRRAELLSMDELWSHLREQDIDSLRQVRRACLESDGRLSVERSDGKGDPRKTPDAAKTAGR